jgi:acyl carrier protein
MKDIILKYVIEQFADNTPKEKRTKHYSYCVFPEGKCTCKDLKEINYDTSLISGGYIDSFSMVVVLIFLEKTFNVKIPDKEATPSNFDTVNKMVELVNKFRTDDDTAHVWR